MKLIMVDEKSPWPIITDFYQKRWEEIMDNKNKNKSAEKMLLSLGKHLEVWILPDGKIAVSYQKCEVKEGCFLKSFFGTGETFNDACEDYLDNLHGKTLVFDAYSSNREEVKVL